MKVYRERRSVEQRYFSIRQAAQYLGKRPEAIRMMARRGRIQPIKLGKSIYFDRLDLDQVMKDGKLNLVA